MVTAGKFVKIGQDAGVVQQVYTSPTGALVELRMVKNAFGQGTKEIITLETVETLAQDGTEQDIAADIQRRFLVILRLLQATLPIPREQLYKIATKAIEAWHVQDQE